MPKPWDWYLVVPILTIAHNADRGQFFFYVHTRFINFEKFFPPTCLFHPTGLLILRNFSHIHVYSILHIYLFLIKTHVKVYRVSQIEDKSIQLIRGSFITK